MAAYRLVHEHVPAVTIVLSIISLGVVFSAAFQILPVATLPSPRWVLTAIPSVNAVISLGAIVTILGGVRAIRRGHITRHKRYMIASFVLFAVFLGLYLYRVAILGPTEFAGPSLVRQYVYLPILLVHVGLAIVCVPFVYYALLLGLANPVEEIYRSRHRTVGRIAAGLWLISFSMGLVIYLLLYHMY